MNAYERFAVDHFLCRYPDNFSYQDVLNHLHLDDPNNVLTPWDSYTPYTKPWLGEEIFTLCDALETRFTPIKKEDEA